MRAEARLDPGLLDVAMFVLTLSLLLKCVSVNQVISGLEIVAPCGRRLGSCQAREGENDGDSKSGE